MKIETIKIRNEGHIPCRSGFYSVRDTIEFHTQYKFSTGLTFLRGDIDSGNWGISCLLSIPECNQLKDSLHYPLSATVNGTEMPLEKLWPYACYMDEAYPLFSGSKPANKLIERELKKSDIQGSPEEIRDLFHMSPERFSRPIGATGHEKFKAMSAIGYAGGKQVFCFPWFSKRRLYAFGLHMPDLFHILNSLGKMVIVPIGLTGEGNIYRPQEKF